MFSFLILFKKNKCTISTYCTMENEINTENFYKAPLDERVYAGFSVQAIMQKTGN